MKVYLEDASCVPNFLAPLLFNHFEMKLTIGIISIALICLGRLCAEEPFIVNLSSAFEVTISDETLGDATKVLLVARKATIGKIILNFVKHRERVVVGGGKIERVEVHRCDTRMLDLWQCGFREIVFGYGPIRIENLFLRGSELSEIIPMNQVNGLRRLMLSDNKIIRADLARLRVNDLEFLDLANNGLTTIEGMESMKQLGGLDLRDNKLSDVPMNVMEIPGLSELYVRLNPLSSEALARIRREAKYRNIEMDP